MRASRIILLLVALLAGGLAAFLATRGDAPTTVVVEGPSTIIEEAKARILVAKAPIGVGQRLSPTVIEWQDWPELAVRPEYITETALPDALTEMTGTVARFELFPGEPIMQQKLVRAEQGYLSAVLSKGMRAVSVEVTAASASGGYIVPNDRVDVVLTRPSSTGIVSETLLSNVKVLAIGLRLGETGTTGAPAEGEGADPRAEVFQDTAIATLELDPAQGEAIINGSRTGTLALVLRSIADFAAAGTPVERQQAGRSIRVIRYGRGVDVMSSAPGGPELAPAAFDEPPAAPAPAAGDAAPADVEVK